MSLGTRSVWAVVLAALVALTAVGMDAFARQAFLAGHSISLIPPVVYVSQRPADPDIPILLVIGGLITIVGVSMLVLKFAGRHARDVPAAVGLSLAFILGGSLANDLEIAGMGTVTDFLGIHGPNGGIYSAGDLAVSAGIGLVPLAAFQLVKKSGGVLAALVTSVAAYAIIVVVAILVPHRLGLAIPVTVISVIGLAVFAAAQLIARTGGAREHRAEPMS